MTIQMEKRPKEHLCRLLYLDKMLAEKTKGKSSISRKELEKIMIEIRKDAENSSINEIRNRLLSRPFTNVLWFYRFKNRSYRKTRVDSKNIRREKYQHDGLGKEE